MGATPHVLVLGETASSAIAGDLHTDDPFEDAFIFCWEALRKVGCEAIAEACVVALQLKPHPSRDMLLSHKDNRPLILIQQRLQQIQLGALRVIR